MSICENTVQVDDFEPSIVYSGPWQAFHDKTYGINGTGHVATRTGLSANFKFNGRSDLSHASASSSPYI